MKIYRTLSLVLAGCALTYAQSFNLRPGVTYPSQNGTQAQNGTLTATRGDFNGDGRLDIAVGNTASSSVSIYLGEGDGTFAAASTVSIPGGCLAGFLAAGDFNRDGKTDVLAACQFQSVVWVLPGMGNGQFGPPISTTLPAIAWFGFVESNAQNIAVADFNNDGTPDLVIGFSDNNADAGSLSVNLMLSNGDGTFQAPVMIVSGVTFVPSNVMAADFNLDGNQDLAIAGMMVSGQTSAIEIFPGTGKGTFQAPSNFAVPVVPALGFGTVADVNNDGVPDIVLAGRPVGTTNEVSQVCVYTGAGDGTFKQSFTAQETEGQLVLGLLAADLRGTGTLDLIEDVGKLNTVGASTPSFSLAVRAGNGDGTFQSPVPLAYPLGLEPWMYGMLAGDWNGDGLTDLAFASLPSFAPLPNNSTASGLQNALNGESGSVVVILNANTPAPALAVSTRQLQFSFVAGGTAPAAQSAAISNSGAGTLTWTASANSPWLNVSPTTGSAPANLTISVSPGSMAPATYTGTVQIAAAGALDSPQTIVVTLVVSATGSIPAITGVVNGASFQPGIESGSWVTIQGVNLAPDTRTWQASDFNGNNLPLSLDGASVTIAGASAAVYYISPTQINVQAPTVAATGAVPVVVTNNGQMSAVFTAQLQTYSPAFFLYTGTSFAIASHFPDYALVGSPSAIPGTIAAQPGDVLILWATGVGPTNPPTPAGVVVSGSPPAATQPTITVGGVPVTVVSTVLSPGSVGLYQVAIQLPANVPTGVVAIQASVGGVQSPAGVVTFVAGQ